MHPPAPSVEEAGPSPVMWTPRNAVSPDRPWPKSGRGALLGLGGVPAADTSKLSTHGRCPDCDWPSIVARCAVNGLAAARWLRQHWTLWGTLASVAIAFAFPRAATPSDLVICISAAVVFFFVGTASPLEELASSARNVRAVAFCFLQWFVVSPLLALGIRALPLYDSEAKQLMLIGVVCTLCLPPPTAINLVSSSAAAGTEMTALYLSAAGNVAGLLLTPLLARLLAPTHVPEHRLKSVDGSPLLMRPIVDLRDPSSFAARFGLTVIIPFALGLLAQNLVISVRRKAASQWRASVGQSALGDTACDAAPSTWRHRVRGLTYLVMLALNYVVFSTLFLSPEKARARDVTADSVLTGIGLLLATHIVLCSLSWFVGRHALGAHTTPEDRIAVFFASVQKADVLAVPMLSQLFAASTATGGPPPGFAAIVLPALIYHLIQSVGGAALVFALQAWRQRQHCKPGTTLLPQRYMRPLSALARTPSSSVAAGLAIVGGVPVKTAEDHV